MWEEISICERTRQWGEKGEEKEKKDILEKGEGEVKTSKGG